MNIQMRFRKLTKYERKILETIASTIIPHPRGIFKKSVFDVDIASKVEYHLGHLSKEARLAYRFFLILIAVGAPFYRLKFKRFGKMDRETRKEYLEAWHRTWLVPKRIIARFVEALIMMNYYTTPEVASECGWRPKFSPPLPPPSFPKENLKSNMEGEIEIEKDVCVIGSGAGGAPLAAELAMAGRSVVIIEEGGFFSAEDFRDDPIHMTNMLYRDGGLLVTFGFPNIVLPLGKCVGGTTLINSGSCFRCPDHVLNRWVWEFGLSKWAPERLKKYFEQVEKTIGVSVPPENLTGGNTRVFKKGLERLGLKGGIIPRNATHCKGSGVCAFGCPTRAKKSMEQNYIPIALSHGAELYTNCRAEKILYEKSLAKKVICSFIDPSTRRKKGHLVIKAKIIVVACGTLHTPVLLKRSSLPDPGGQIGRNLTIHPAAKVIALFDEEVRAWDGIPQSYYLDDLIAEGIRFEQIFTPPALVAPNIILSGEEHSEIMAKYNQLACFGMIIQDSSRGKVFALPNGKPFIWYSLNKYDLAKFKKGIHHLVDIFFAAGATKVFPCIYKFPAITKDDGADIIYKKRISARDLDLQAFHPLGTCRMGANPKESAVDADGRLYGMDNVYISDGSIFPTSLGVNPQITIMAAALKIAEHINKDRF